MKDKRRMRIVKRLIAVMTAAAVIFSLTACGAEETSKEDKKEETQYRVSKHINLPISPIKSLNPCNSKDEDTYFIARLVYDGLFTFFDDFYSLDR